MTHALRQACCVLASLTIACTGVARPASRWWTYQADFLRTGSTATPFPPPLELAWNAPFVETGSASRPPVFGSQKVFSTVGMNPGTTRALTLAGAPLWSFQATVPGGSSFHQRGSLVVADTRVYGAFERYDEAPRGRIVALRETDGSVLWTQDLPSIPIATTLVAYTSVLATTSDGSRLTLHSLRAGSGQVEWSQTIDDDDEAFAAPAIGVGMILLPGRRALHAFRTTGQRAWRFQFADRLFVSHPTTIPRASPEEQPMAVVAGVVRNDAAPPHDDEIVLHAINARTGQALWTKRRTVDYTNNSVFAAATGERIILLTGTHVFAVRTSDGEQLWARRVPTRLQFSPALASDVLYFTDGQTLLAWNAADGTSIWSAALPVTSPLWQGGIAIDQGLLVISHDGGLLAYRRASP
jgi:outer membrane protein assembly factor BamB